MRGREYRSTGTLINPVGDFLPDPKGQSLRIISEANEAIRRVSTRQPNNYSSISGPRGNTGFGYSIKVKPFSALERSLSAAPSD